MSKTLLIVEDSPVVATLVRKIIERNSHHTKLACAANGKEGVEKLKAEKPNLVILDWMMPDYDGKYFLDEQKKDAEVAGVPVIIHSAVSKEEVEPALQEFTNVMDYLQKPVIPTKLFERIREYLEQ